MIKIKNNKHLERFISKSLKLKYNRVRMGKVDENKNNEKEIQNNEEKEELKQENELQNKLKEQKQKIEEQDDRYKRLLAEFENLKKRNIKERESLYNSVLADIVSGFLPVIDNLEKAVEAKTADEDYKKGIELVLKQFKDVLTSNGVKEIEALGVTFNPEYHEAVSMVEDENLGEKEVKEVLRKGYIVGNRVVRHAMVIVAN